MTTAQAQELSKEAKKELKKKAKEFQKNPEALQMMLEEYDELQTEVSQAESAKRKLEQDVQVLTAESQLKTDKLTGLQSENEMLQMQLVEARTTLPEQPKGVPAEVETSQEMLAGVVYKVQIGAYKKRQIDEELMSTDNMDVEEQAGLKKVVVGQFRDFDRAKSLQDELVAMGVKGAWVVAYQDGNRIPLKDARAMGTSTNM
jgi:predicted  nucleic acid-binding Zn-ribbon protein